MSKPSEPKEFSKVCYIMKNEGRKRDLRDVAIPESHMDHFANIRHIFVIASGLSCPSCHRADERALKLVSDSSCSMVCSISGLDVRRL